MARSPGPDNLRYTICAFAKTGRSIDLRGRISTRRLLCVVQRNDEFYFNGYLTGQRIHPHRRASVPTDGIAEYGH